MSTHADDRTRRLLDVGRSVIAELDSEAVLTRIIEEARAITGARFAALGVLDDQRRGLERFLTSGIDAETHRSIGELPHGRGVLGVLIDDPQPLRLGDVGSHPQSYGFPSGHPEMHSFLGVPIMIRGHTWGNLYLAEKETGEEFDDGDEEALVVLARWAAVAIENARLYELSERRRSESERAVRSLHAARDITDAIGGVEELDRVLELIVKRGRALVEARTVLILLREGDDLVVAASAGYAPAPPGHRLSITNPTSGQVLQRGMAQRIADISSYIGAMQEDLGVPEAQSALLVPMIHRGAPLGVLAAFDRGTKGGAFSRADEQLLGTFAQSAANAVAIRRSVQAERLHSAIAAADAERRRCARELHDQTLQALGGLRVLLAAAARRKDPAGSERAIAQAVSDIELEIDNLRGIISDLRPSLLDDLGLRPALEALLNRHRGKQLEIIGELELPEPHDDGPPLAPALETTIYRLVQESITNAIKHSGATLIKVSVALGDEQLLVEVTDNGGGFDPTATSKGFGLTGMRERVYLEHGTLELESSDEGTTVRALLPARRDAGKASRELRAS